MGWAGTLLIVRHLSVTDWGRFTFVFGLLGMSAVITNMANPRVVFRSLAEDDGRVAGTYVLLRLALGVLTYAVSVTVVVAGHYPAAVVRATVIAGLVVVIANSSSGYDVLFQFRMQLSKVAVASILGQVAQLGLTVVLALMGSSMVIFTVPAVLCEVVALAWKLFRLPKHPRLRYGFLWRRWLELIKLSIPLAIGGALVTLYYSLDTVMLSKMQTFRAVGIYGITYKFAGIVAIFGPAMSAALYPILVRHWSADQERFRTVLIRAIRLSMVAGALVLLEFMLFAAKAISLLYGHHYTLGANAARLVVASECLGFFVSLAVVALVSMDRNLLYPLAALCGLVLNLGINLWVIPRWSYMGAAWATLATEVVVTASLWIPLKRFLGFRVLDIGSVARILLCSGFALAVSVGASRVFSWPAAAAAGACVYVAALALTRIGGKEGPWLGLKSLVQLDHDEMIVK